MHMIQDVLDFVVKSIVEDSHQVRIETIDQGEQCTAYEISVAEGDRGKIIGKDGKTIRALRGLVQALSDKDVRVVLKGDNPGR